MNWFLKKILVLLIRKVAGQTEVFVMVISVCPEAFHIIMNITLIASCSKTLELAAL